MNNKLKNGYVAEEKFILECLKGKVSNICVSEKGAYSKYFNNWDFE